MNLLKYIAIAVCLSGFPQQEKILLFDKSGIYESNEINTKLIKESSIQNKIISPQMWYYPTKEKKSPSASILVIPGGGYKNLAFEKEGLKVAEWLNTLGINAFVLMYRTPYWEKGEFKKHVALYDAKLALRIIRYNASNWNLNPNKIGVLGFSAGGHLASTLSTQFDYGKKSDDKFDEISSRPDFSVLVYPVISMRNAYTHKGSKQSLLGNNPNNKDVVMFSNELQVKEDTPPTILIHASDDQVVSPKNSILFYKALLKNKIPVSLHILDKGGHGFGLYQKKGSVKFWPEMVSEWFKQRGIL